MKKRVCVAGYFPPPVTGQTMATQRLADLLSPVASVDQINLNEKAENKIETAASFQSQKVIQYIAGGKKLKAYIEGNPESTLLWTSISPQMLGHMRDLITVYPGIKQSQRVLALSHWGNFDRVFRQPTTRLTAKLLLQRLDGLVFLNNQLAQNCAAWIPDHKRFIIPNTIDDTVCASVEELHDKRMANGPESRLRILFLSNMIESKGYLDLLEALIHLKRSGTPFRARFAGRWLKKEDEDAFNNALSYNQLTADVSHLGPVNDRKKVKALHLWADVFVLPTYYPTEAQPLVLLEAMNAGTPVVATAHSGIPEMIKNGKEGILVPKKSPEAIATALEKLTSSDLWLRYSRNAEMRFLRFYSPKIVRAMWKTVLQSS